MKNKKVLIATLPRYGGVGTKSKWLIKILKKNGFTPIIAYYEPYSVDPSLSAPLPKLFSKKIAYEEFLLEGDQCYRIGAYLPELELTHYWNTKIWQELIESADYHLVISGNILPGLAFWQTKVPYLVWAASPYSDDRKERVKSFPWYRKLFDRLINLPVSSMVEKLLLKQANILSVSQATERGFRKLGMPAGAILPIPVETEIFKPDFTQLKPWRIGLVARLDDPRKNLSLLIAAVALLKKDQQPFELVLVGARPSAADAQSLSDLNLGSSLIVYDFLEQAELVKLLQSLDVFIISSWQEGLCIAGLEAMAVGCPVIATRCGGPEDYVIDGKNGYLIDFDSKQLAAAIEKICSDRALRNNFSAAAYAMVQTRYSEAVAEAIFWENFNKVFKLV